MLGSTNRIVTTLASIIVLEEQSTMNTILHEWFGIVLRSALFLGFATIAVSLVIRWWRISSIRLQRLAWAIVLLQGCWLFGFHYGIQVDTEAWIAMSPTPDWSFEQLSEIMPTESSETRSSDEPSSGSSVDSQELDDSRDSVWSGTPWLGKAVMGSESSSTTPANTTTSKGPFGPSNSPAGTFPWRKTASRVLQQLWMIAAWVWWIGGVFVFLRCLLSWGVFQLSLCRYAREARKEWQTEWQTLTRANRLRSRVRVLEHDHFGPMLTWTPTGAAVVVPSDFWEELSASQRLAVLRHEAAHYERRDIWWSLIARLIVWPQWFNPLAWHALNRFDECAEWSCDETLLRVAPRDVAEYAKALLAMVEFPSGLSGRAPFAARAANGSSVSYRIRRLLMPQTREEKMAGKLGFVSVVMVLFLAGFVRFELESQSKAMATEIQNFVEKMESGSTAVGDEEVQLAKWVAELDVEHDRTGLMARLKESLKTEPGRIVLSERIANEESNLRRQAEQEPTPVYISEFFQKSGDRYTLRPGKESYPQQFMAEWKSFEKNIGLLRPKFKEFAASLQGESEASQLLKRFLLDDASATLIYLHRIQDRVEPDYRTIRDRFNDIFVLDRDQKLIIRAGGRGKAEQDLKMLERAQRIADRIARDTTEWKKDLSKTDEMAKVIQSVMSESLYASMIALDNLNEDYSIDQRVDMYFENLEYRFVDRADGLVPSDEQKEEIKQGLLKYRNVRQFVEKIRPSLIALTSEIKEGDLLAERWKKALTTDVALAWLASVMDPSGSDPIVAAQELFDQWTVEREKGGRDVNPDRVQEVENSVREWLKESRNMRRRGQEMDEFAKLLDNAELAKSYQSFTGKCLISRSVRDLVTRRYYDGFAHWSASHFDTTDDGIVLKEGHDYEVQSMLEQVENVKRELANDDF